MKFLIFLTVFVFSCPAFSLAYPADTAAVLDGDTIVIRDGGQKRKIRLYGVDCPEKGQKYGPEAAAIAAQALSGRGIEVIPRDTDRYGRTVAVIKVGDGQTLQEILLRAGAAWLYPQYCKSWVCARWKMVELQARWNGVGLWAEKTPTPPWEWRRGNAGR